MIKTTSYEISKELEEIDFDVDTIFYYDSENEECQIWHELPIKLESEFVKSFDLETILDALPKDLIIEGNYCILTLWTKGKVIFYANIMDKRFYECRNEGESLADTAARLLITLIKDKIVKL